MSSHNEVVSGMSAMVGELMAACLLMRNPTTGKMFLHMATTGEVQGTLPASSIAPQITVDAPKPITMPKPAAIVNPPVKPVATGTAYDKMECSELYEIVKSKGLKDGKRGLHLSKDRMISLLNGSPSAPVNVNPPATTTANPPAKKSGGGFKGKGKKDNDKFIEQVFKVEEEWEVVKIRTKGAVWKDGKPVLDGNGNPVIDQSKIKEKSGFKIEPVHYPASERNGNIPFHGFMFVEFKEELSGDRIIGVKWPNAISNEQIVK